VALLGAKALPRGDYSWCFEAFTLALLLVLWLAFIGSEFYGFLGRKGIHLKVPCSAQRRQILDDLLRLLQLELIVLYSHLMQPMLQHYFPDFLLFEYLLETVQFILELSFLLQYFLL